MTRGEEANAYYPSTMDYVLDSPASGNVLKAVTVNISNTGLSALVFSPHAEGQKIIIKSILPVDSRVATVRWITEQDESMFLTGLMFVDRTPPA